MSLPDHLAQGRSSLLPQHAHGRVVLAGLPAAQLRRLHKSYVDKLGEPRDHDTFEALRAQLKLIRERGFDVDRDVAGGGVAAISVAVNDAQANAVGSLTLGVDGTKLTEARIAGLARKLSDVSQGITARLTA